MRLAPWLGVAGVCGASLLLTAYIASVILERIPHVQDSVTYFFQAKTFASGRLYVPSPPQPEFFEQEFVVNYEGKWFSKYPPGHALVLAAGVLAGAPWLVNPVSGAIALLVIYLLGARVYSHRTGLMGAALALTSPFYLFMSASFMAHPTSLLFILLFALFFVAVAQGGRWPAAVAAGATLGLAFLTRPWTAIGISFPFALYALSTGLRRGWGELGRYAPVAGGFLPFAVALLAYQYLLTGDPFLSPMVLWWPFDRLGFGEGVGMHGPHTPAKGLENSAHNLSWLAAYLYGWPLYLSLIFISLPFLTRRANRWDGLFLAAGLSLVAAYVFYWAEGIMYGPRYYYESLGFLLLLTVRGVEAASGWLAQPHRGWRGSASAWRLSLGPYALLGLLVAYNLAFYLPAQGELHRGYNYVSAAPLRAVEAAGLRNALIFVDPGEPWEWWNYGAVFSGNSPTLDGSVVYARDLGLERDRELMALYPGRRYYRMQGTELREIELLAGDKAPRQYIGATDD